MYLQIDRWHSITFLSLLKLRVLREARHSSHFLSPLETEICWIKEWYFQQRLQSMTKCYVQISSRNFHDKTSNGILHPLSPSAFWDTGVCETLKHLVLPHRAAERKPIQLLCCPPQGSVAGSMILLDGVAWGWDWVVVRLDSLADVILTSEVRTSIFLLQMLKGTLKTEF